MKWTLPALLATGSLFAQGPSVPSRTTPILSPKHAATIASMGAPMRKPLLVVIAPDPLYLTWDYPINPIPSNIVFEVWHSRYLTNTIVSRTNLFSVPTGWTLFATVVSPPVKVGGFLNDFFIARALDTNTGLYSYWNQ